MKPEKRIRTCAREGCGNTFEIKENQRNKKYCCPECAKIVQNEQKQKFKENNAGKQREYMAAYREKTKQLSSLSKSDTVPGCRRRYSTDWNAIVRICEEHKVSYGQAVAMNLIP